MKVQKSFEKQDGILYVVATPIGNLQDISLRAKDILRQVKIIAAEDTRRTRKLLSYFQISTPLMSYHQHNQYKIEAQIIERLSKGESIALVTDAGIPGISDPGELLITKAIKTGIPVVPIPGPNAALSALVTSGLSIQPFIFVGFLPRSKKKRKDELQKLREISATLLFYEAPHRLLNMLVDIQEVFGDRKVAISRELTKKNEEYLRGDLSECIQYIKTAGVKGEYTIVVTGTLHKQEEKEDTWKTYSLIEHVEMYIEKGYTKNEAIKQVAKIRQLPKTEVYKRYHLHN
jgi:16S rRNA (cytidine1402-2'-O)-methyltransferase